MSHSRLPTRSIWIRGAVVTIIATGLNIVVALSAAALVAAPSTFLPLSLGPVASVTVLVLLAGIMVYALINRISTRPDNAFAIVSGAVAILSLVAPVMIAINPGSVPARFGEATTAAALALIPLHLIPAVALIIALRWRPAHTKE